MVTLYGLEGLGLRVSSSPADKQSPDAKRLRVSGLAD